MAEHDVSCTVPRQELRNADIEFKVRGNNQVLGTLKISKGGIEWFPKHAQKKRYRMSWEKFAQLVQSPGNKRK